MSKINVNDIRIGYVIEYDSRLWVVLRTMHTQPGKGGAYMQLEIRDIKSGTKSNVRLRTSDTVEKVHIEKLEYQFLYFEGDAMVLMNNNTYDQIFVNKVLVNEEELPFLQDGMNLLVEFVDGEPVLIHLPTNGIFTIVDCEAALQNQTAAPSYKAIVLDNGVRLSGPPFLSVGDKVVVNISTREYVKRSD